MGWLEIGDLAVHLTTEHHRLTYPFQCGIAVSEGNDKKGLYQKNLIKDNAGRCPK